MTRRAAAVRPTKILEDLMKPVRVLVVRVCVPLALLSLGGAAGAQAKIRTFYGETPDGTFGYAVDTAGDLDGDGHDDVIVSGVDYGTFVGYVRVLSGKDGSVLRAFDEHASGTGLGSDVAGGGDADGDGWPDLAIGAYWDSVAYHYGGSVRVYSGRNNDVLHVFSGDAAFTWFGLAVDWLGDVDLDGHDDLIVGAFGSNENGTESGRAQVYSGADGHLMYSYPGDEAFDEYGRSVSGLGDVDGDGHPDFLIGGYDSNTADALGYVRVYSGRDGSVIRSHRGGVGAAFGQSVAGVGDLDGDGRPEYVVGAHVERHPSSPFVPHGSARVFSGRDGHLLHTFWGTPYSTFGFAVAGPGDVDGDGFPEIVISAPSVTSLGGNSRYVEVRSGADGSLLFQVEEGAEQFGNAVGGAGDVNGDGRMDVLVADYKNEHAGPSAGVAYVLAGGCPTPTVYCTSAPNSAGPGARISHEGGPGIAANNFVLDATGAVPGHLGLFFYGDGRDELPFGDGWICVAGAMHRLGPALAAGPHGALARPLDLTAPPAGSGQGEITPGSTWHFQLWYRDPAASGAGFNFSDALSVRFTL